MAKFTIFVLAVYLFLFCWIVFWASHQLHRFSQIDKVQTKKIVEDSIPPLDLKPSLV